MHGYALRTRMYFWLVAKSERAWTRSFAHAPCHLKGLSTVLHHFSVLYRNRKHTVWSVQTCSGFSGKWVETFKTEFFYLRSVFFHWRETCPQHWLVDAMTIVVPVKIKTESTCDFCRITLFSLNTNVMNVTVVFSALAVKWSLIIRLQNTCFAVIAVYAFILALLPQSKPSWFIKKRR